MKAAREPLSYMGVNIVGLQRRAFTQEKNDTISQIYHLLFVGSYSMSSGIDRIEKEIPDGEVKNEILQFVQHSKAGVIKRYAKNGVDES